MTTDEYIRSSLLEREARIAAARADVISKVLIAIEDERLAWVRYINGGHANGATIVDPVRASHRYNGAIAALHSLKFAVGTLRDAD